MAAVLACGPEALLSHRSAAALLGIRKEKSGPAEVVVPADVVRRHDGIRVYRRARSIADRAAGADPKSRRHEPLRWRRVDGIPVTGPAVVLVDLASCLPTWELEAAVNEADHLDLLDPEQLRAAIESLPRRPGRRRLRELLDSAGLALTSTRLESLFLPLALAAGLSRPTTQAAPRGHRVDFLWPELGLVVEADSLRYHRTAFKQARDKRRDNAHAAAGLTTLRFTHSQIRHDPAYVRRVLHTTKRLKLERKRGR